MVMENLIKGVLARKLNVSSKRFNLSIDSIKSIMKNCRREYEDQLYDPNKFSCPNCGKQIRERRVFEYHLDLHFQAKTEKSQLSTQKSPGFIDKKSWQNLSFNFIISHSILTRLSARKQRDHRWFPKLQAVPFKIRYRKFWPGGSQRSVKNQRWSSLFTLSKRKFNSSSA